MTMPPGLRKLALTTHVGSLGLTVAGMTSRDAHMVRAAYLALDLTARFVLVPLSIASLLTRIVQLLGTPWGLFRHYWVLFKLMITTLAAILLLVHLRPISYMASVAAETTLSRADSRGLRIDLVVKAGLTLLALLVATVLSVYKPQGMPRHGWRKQYKQHKASWQ